MNTWILDTTIARLPSTNAVVLTAQPNSQMASRKLSRKRSCGGDRSPDAGYAATRFSSNLNCRTSKFGWLQAIATEGFFPSSNFREPLFCKRPCYLRSTSATESDRGRLRWVTSRENA